MSDVVGPVLDRYPVVGPVVLDALAVEVYRKTEPVADLFGAKTIHHYAQAMKRGRSNSSTTSTH